MTRLFLCFTFFLGCAEVPPRRPPPAPEPEEALVVASASASAPVAAPPVLPPCDNVLFNDGLAAQLATRPDDGVIRFPKLGLEADTASPAYTLADGFPFDQATFDCMSTAVRVYRAGAFFTPTDEAGARSKAELWGATNMAAEEADDGLVLLAEGTDPAAPFMVFALRTIGDRKIYCEATSKTAAGRDAMRAICLSLRISVEP